MSLEACATFGWPYAGIAQRLNRHPNEIQQLVRFRMAIEAAIAIGIQAIPVQPSQVVAATAISQQYGLLSNDALIVALMQEEGLSEIASHDADFDRVAGIRRFESV